MSHYKEFAPNRVLAASLLAVGNEIYKQREALRVTISTEKTIWANIVTLSARRANILDAVQREQGEMLICDRCEKYIDTIADPLTNGFCEKCHRDDEREKEKAE